ncbi:hypothetical protein ACJIZ3_017945 [Penstemon smallii]|uniref:Interactor of constitutive active ROPs 3-like n=1 Tax=Penstemon smallii TaxID=265156 RepID=A0ABD3SY91_9LAMI
MQTPKPRTNSSGSSQRKSPQSISSQVSQKVSPRVVRQLRTGAPYSDTSSNQETKGPKEKSPKDIGRRSPRSPISEKKHPRKVGELESQISQLENDLKNVKDQLCYSETSKKQAQKEVGEANQKLLALSKKLEESQEQLLDNKVHTADETLATQTDQSHDSAALASALDEIKQLKSQLEIVAESEATQNLKEKLVESHLLVEDMKNELRFCKESEVHAQEIVGETLKQLETAKKMMETFKSDGCKATEAYDAIASELDQSKARVNFLEELVIKLKADINKDSQNEGDLQTELNSIRSDLEAAEMRYNDEQVRTVEQIRQAFKMVEEIKSSSSHKESELMKSKYLIEELKANLMDKETELQGICEENEDLKTKLGIDLEATKAAEREALMKLGYMTEEVGKSKHTAEQLEAELRRMKVQADQWRKAAEAAAAMLTAGNNGQVMGRTGSMDSNYSPRNVRIDSPYGDEVDEDLMKKRNGNVLKKIGVLWKKPQK